MKLILMVILMLYTNIAFTDEATDAEMLDSIDVIKKEPLRMKQWNLKTLYDIYSFEKEMDLDGHRIVIIHPSKDSIIYEIFINRVLHMDMKYYDDMMKARRAVGDGSNVVYLEDNVNMSFEIYKRPSSVGYTDKGLYKSIGDQNDAILIDINPSWD